MNMIDKILSPSLSVELFFSSKAISSEKSLIGCIHLGLPERMALAHAIDQPDQQLYVGQLEDDTRVELAGCLAHDTHLLRLMLSQDGLQNFDVWHLLEAHLQEVLESAWVQPENPYPWGSSYLYHTLLPVENISKPDLTYFPIGVRQHTFEPTSDATPFGWLWLLSEGGETLGSRTDIWSRSIALLTPEDRSEKVTSYFLNPLTQGLSRIELYLQKSKHHARQREMVRDQLEGASLMLQDGMGQAITVGDSSQLHREHGELERISHLLLRFLTQIASLEVLLNSLQTNRLALSEHLERVKLDTPFYRNEIQHIDRHIEQLSADIRNARVVVDSTYSFQDIQRGVEASRLERASFMMGAAAALLAGVAIFNSFLDIWNLALEGSGLLRPASWLRILLGFIAGVSFPLSAAWFVQKRMVRGVAMLLLGVLSVAAAIITTALVNG